MGNTDKIVIRDLRRAARIGIYDHEKTAPQPVLINLEVTVSPREKTENSIHTVLNYEDIINGIDTILSTGHIDLVETLADKIVEMCFHLPQATALTLRIEKTEVFENCGGAGVEITRTRL